MNIKDQKEFPVDSAQLKEVRNFARGLFDQVPEFEDNREELVLALAEAAQNIVKHAYSGQPSGDTMRVEIEYQDKVLKMELFDFQIYNFLKFFALAISRIFLPNSATLNLNLVFKTKHNVETCHLRR